MKNIFKICAMVFLAAVSTFAQGTLQQSDVRSTPGPVVPGAQVTICTSNAAGTPCFPKANIYTDPLLTVPSVNPITADGNGNYNFYAAAGTYVESITGQGLPGRTFTIMIPCVPGSTGCSGGGGGGGAPAPPFGSVQYNSSGVLGPIGNSNYDPLTGALTLPLVGNVFIKSAASDKAYYASLNGSDSNDCLSWGSACLTLTGAFNKLAGSGGTIYFTSGVNASPTAGVGLWLMGLADPNYASPPAGWLKTNSTQNLAFIGIGSVGGGASGRGGPAAIIGNGGTCGSQTDATKPCIWLSDTSNAILFKNVAIEYPAIGVKIAIDSNGNRGTSTGTTGWNFENLSCNLNQIAGSGPCMDIGSGAFFGRIQDSELAGNNACTALQDCAQALVINPGSGPGSGDIFLYDDQVNGGGIVEYPGNTSYGIYISDLTGESLQTGGALVHFKNSNGALDASLRNIVSFDASGGAAVLNDAGLASSIHVEGLVQGGFGADSLQGPMTYNGNSAIGYASTTVTPEVRSQQGIGFGNRFVGQFDASRRSFGPVASRFVNRVSTLPASWTPSGTQTRTTVVGPDGVANGAGHIASSSGGIDNTVFGSYVASGTGASGDTFVYGAWVRSTTSNGFSNSSPLNLSINNSNILAGNQNVVQYILGDGEWEWMSGIAKITTLNNPTYTLTFAGSTDSTHTAEFYAPVLLAIPNGTISANEAAYLAEHLAPFASGCVAGNICGLPGQALSYDTLHANNGFNFYADTGAANAYIITTAPTVTSLATGVEYTFQAVHANTGTSTLNVDGIGTVTIKKNGGTGGSVGSNLASGDIAAGQVVDVVYDGTNFQMQSTLGNAGGGGGSGTVGNCVNAPAVAYYSGAGTTTTCLNLPAFMQYIYAADSGAVNAYVVAPTTAATLVTGAQIAFTTANANTGASTINVSSLGVKALTKYGATALVAGDISANTYYLAVYDGTEWQVLNPSAPQANVVLKNAVNTFTATGSLDRSASTLPSGDRIPNINGGITTLNGAEVYNVGDGNIHVGANGTDNYVGIVPTTVTLLDADCAQWHVVSTTKTLNDAGGGGCTLLNANNVFGASARLNLAAATNANAFVIPNQAGAAPTAAGGIGFDTTTLQPFVSDGVIACPFSKEQVNTQSGSGYTALTTDCGKIISVSNAGAQTLLLPASPPSKGWFIDVENTGTGTWTVSPNGNNLDNAAGSTTIATNQGMRIVSSGSGYFSMRGVGGSGGGGGSVNPSGQFSVPYYSNPGASSTLSGQSAPSSPSGVPQFEVSIPSGGNPTAPIFAPAGVVPRIVAGASDTILATDRAGEVIYTDSVAVAVTLPAAGSAGFASNFVAILDYTGNAILTITPTTSTINGAATLTMGQNDYCFIYSDNSNYYANCTHGQSSAPVVLDTGAANAYVIAYPQIQSLQTGSTVLFTVAHANTIAATINVNGLGVKALDKNGATALIANDLVTTGVYQAVYDGTEWQLLNPGSENFSNFTAHKFFGNNTASTAAPSPVSIGSSDTSPNWFASDSGAANAYVVAPSPAILALTTGVQVNFTPANANSGASTINVSGLGVKALDKLNVAALVSGDILVGGIYSAVYDGTEWIVLNPSTGSGSGTVNNCGTAKSAAYYSGTGTTTSCTSESALTQYLYAADSGAVNAYVITLAPALGSLVTGEQAFFTTANANTTASTINVNGLGVKNITKDGATALVANDILASAVYEIVWDGTEWQLLNPSTLGAATASSLLASGIVDGKAPVTVTTSASATLGGTYNSGYTFNEEATLGTAITYTLPTAAAGKQYCVKNAYNGGADTGTLELLTSAAGQFIIFTDGTLSATGGFVISGGAAADSACVVGVDTTHWILYVQSGTWTKH